MTTFDPEKLACPICQETLYMAIETSCGHAFCEHCLNQCLEAKPNVCPVCHKNPSPVHPSYLLRSLCDPFNVDRPEKDNGSGPATAEKNLGNDSYNKKKYSDAIVHYNNALDRNPKDDLEKAVIHNNRAQCYIQLQQYHRALIDLEDCIRLNPAGEIKVKATIRKAMCQSKIGDFKNSRQSYQTALQLDKNRKFRDTILHSLKSLPGDSAPSPVVGRPNQATAPNNLRPNMMAQYMGAPPIPPYYTNSDDAPFNSYAQFHHYGDTPPVARYPPSQVPVTSPDVPQPARSSRNASRSQPPVPDARTVLPV